MKTYVQRLVFVLAIVIMFATSSAAWASMGGGSSRGGMMGGRTGRGGMMGGGWWAGHHNRGHNNGGHNGGNYNGRWHSFGRHS